MYLGYFKFAGTEVINVARSMAYIEAGYGAAGVEYDTPVASEGLADSLGETYRTPVLDGAPWYDENSPDTWGFAGVLPLDITGLKGTTSSTTVVENIGEGGVAQKARRSSRTIAASALLVGNTSEAVDAGLRWLTSVLYRTCETGALPFEGAQLDGFTVLPGGLSEQEDLDAAMVDTAVAPTDPGWVGYGGTYHPDTSFFQVEPQPNTAITDVDGGHPATVPATDLDGGASDGTGGAGPDTDGGSPGDPGAGDPEDGGEPAGGEFTEYADGGDTGGADTYEVRFDGGGVGAGTPEPYARLVVPVDLTCLSRVVVTWHLTPTTGDPLLVQVGAVDAYGEELHREAPQLLTGATTITWVWEQAEWGAWHPAVWVASPGVVATVSVSRRPFLDPDACLSPLRRSFAGLATVAGPTVVAEFTSDDDCDTKMTQVEWTWVATKPYRYGDAATLLAGLNVTDDTAAASSAEGVSYADESVVAAAGLVCAAPIDDASCGYDPAYPGFVAPPAAPLVTDPGAISPGNYHRRVITIDPTVVPDAGTLALRWSLENTSGTAIRGVRVRLWRQADPDFATHDECGFESEFWVNYIDTGVILIADGISGTVTAVCEDGSLAPAAGVMRGAYRGAFDFPTLGCLGRYFIAVDTPSTMAGLKVTLEAAAQEF